MAGLHAEEVLNAFNIQASVRGHTSGSKYLE
jgi:hypothetical protein